MSLCLYATSPWLRCESLVPGGEETFCPSPSTNSLQPPISSQSPWGFRHTQECPNAHRTLTHHLPSAPDSAVGTATPGDKMALSPPLRGENPSERAMNLLQVTQLLSGGAQVRSRTNLLPSTACGQRQWQSSRLPGPLKQVASAPGLVVQGHALLPRTCGNPQALQVSRTQGLPELRTVANLLFRSCCIHTSHPSFHSQEESAHVGPND